MPSKSLSVQRTGGNSAVAEHLDMASDASANSNFDAMFGVEEPRGEEQNEEKSIDACLVDDDVEAATSVEEEALSLWSMPKLSQIV